MCGWFLECKTFWIKVWEKLQPSLSSFAEKFLDCVKTFFCGKLSWLKNFHFVRGKRSWKKTFLFVEKYLDQVIFSCRNLFWLLKSSLTVEKLFDQEKFTFLAEKKILDLIIFKTNISVETIKTNILSLEHKLFCGK